MAIRIWRIAYGVWQAHYSPAATFDQGALAGRLRCRAKRLQSCAAALHLDPQPKWSNRVKIDEDRIVADRGIENLKVIEVEP